MAVVTAAEVLGARRVGVVGVGGGSVAFVQGADHVVVVLSDGVVVSRSGCHGGEVVQALAVSGRLVATCGDDKSLRLWRVVPASATATASAGGDGAGGSEGDDGVVSHVLEQVGLLRHAKRFSSVLLSRTRMVSVFKDADVGGIWAERGSDDTAAAAAAAAAGGAGAESDDDGVETVVFADRFGDVFGVAVGDLCADYASGRDLDGTARAAEVAARALAAAEATQAALAANSEKEAAYGASNEAQTRAPKQRFAPGSSQLLGGSLAMCTALCFAGASDKPLLVAADRDEKIRFCQFPKTYNISAIGFGHTQFASCLDAHPDADEDILVSGGLDGTLRLWNCSTGELLSTTQLPMPSRPEGDAVDTYDPPAVVVGAVATAQGVFAAVHGCPDLLFVPWQVDASRRQARRLAAEPAASSPATGTTGVHPRRLARNEDGTRVVISCAGANDDDDKEADGLVLSLDTASMATEALLPADASYGWMPPRAADAPQPAANANASLASALSPLRDRKKRSDGKRARTD